MTVRWFPLVMGAPCCASVDWERVRAVMVFSASLCFATMNPGRFVLECVTTFGEGVMAVKSLRLDKYDESKVVLCSAAAETTLRSLARKGAPSTLDQTTVSTTHTHTHAVFALELTVAPEQGTLCTMPSG
jgi:hypothetical protein